MAKKRNSGDYYQALRARFAGEADAVEDARFQPPTDPTDRFFGAAPTAEEASAPRLFDPAGVRPLADGLGQRISAHGAAKTTLLTQGLRLLVGVFWLGLAGWYLTVDGTDGGLALAKLFAIIAGAGVAAAICGFLITLATGKTSLNRTREEAVLLGQRLALETHSLDDALGRAGGRGVDTVSADAFLKSVSFAGDGDAQTFSAYLKRGGATGRKRGGAHLFLIALAAAVVIAGALGLGADTSALPLAGYPVALAAVLIGAALYAGAGLIAALCGGGWRARRETHAETAAFTAMRSAFSTARGVAPADLSARLYGRESTSTHMAKRSLDETREYESAPAPDSRNWAGDSRPTFVETGFQAAPKPFRTDAFEKKFRP